MIGECCSEHIIVCSAAGASLIDRYLNAYHDPIANHSFKSCIIAILAKCMQCCIKLLFAIVEFCSFEYYISAFHKMLFELSYHFV